MERALRQVSRTGFLDRSCDLGERWFSVGSTRSEEPLNRIATRLRDETSRRIVPKITRGTEQPSWNSKARSGTA